MIMKHKIDTASYSHLWLTLVGFVMLASCQLIDASSLSPMNSSTTTTTTTTSSPYWPRPGCHLVGHTRTISIPGCVKFNLSTNACRGYCVSYSIPSVDSLGSPTLGNDNPLDRPGNTWDLDIKEPELMSIKKRKFDVNGGDGSSSEQAIVIVGDQSIVHQVSPKSGSNNNHVLGHHAHSSASSSSSASLMQRHQQAKVEAEKRDVISIGQCCNMMDTEDVFVNLRCGTNETRRLVFKSAKKCECFFCKHV